MKIELRNARVGDYVRVVRNPDVLGTRPLTVDRTFGTIIRRTNHSFTVEDPYGSPHTYRREGELWDLYQAVPPPLGTSRVCDMRLLRVGDRVHVGTADPVCGVVTSMAGDSFSIKVGGASRSYIFGEWLDVFVEYPHFARS